MEVDRLEAKRNAVGSFCGLKRRNIVVDGTEEYCVLIGLFKPIRYSNLTTSNFGHRTELMIQFFIPVLKYYYKVKAFSKPK